MKSTALSLCIFTLGATLLTGCSANFVPSQLTADVDEGQTPIGEINGNVHGGQLPVIGGQIYLFAAGTGGYGTASTSLITSGKTGVTCNATGTLKNDCYVLTDSNGNFTVGGDYTCTPGTQVYMVAAGGNPGLSGTSTPSNTAIVQMVGLGQCPAAGNLAAQVPYLVINEVTTVAFAYAMGGFGTDAYHIGSSATSQGQAAIASAMANFRNIVNIAGGGALSAAVGNSTSVAPQTKINTLADIIATCVNQSSATSSSCTNLFNLAKNTAGTAPTDVSTALFNIVHNPDANASAIYGRYAGNSVFAPLLSAAPVDWTMPVVYKNVVGRPGNIAFDSFGNAWISDRTNNAVVKVTPQGVVKKLTNLNNGSSNGSIYQVAVDSANNVWALDYTNSQIYRIDSTGAWESTITGNQLSAPVAISFTSAGSAMVLNSSAAYISRFSSSGIAQTPAGYNQAGYGSLGAPAAIAVDTGGNAFIPENVGCACVGVLTNLSTSATAYNDRSSTADSATAIAIDSSNDPWQAQGNQILEDPTYASGSYKNYTDFFFQGYYFNIADDIFAGLIIVPATPTTLTGGGLNAPVSLAFDGSGYIWAANSGASTISGFNGTTALSTAGFQTGTSGLAYAAAPDISGNMWTANSDGTVTQLLGLVTPTATPVYPGQIAKTP